MDNLEQVNAILGSPFEGFFGHYGIFRHSRSALAHDCS